MTKRHSLNNFLLIIALFLLGALPVTAQKNFTIRHFDESKGLTSNFTEALTQSISDGQLIVANKGGIDHFDGFNSVFKVLQN